MEKEKEEKQLTNFLVYIFQQSTQRDPDRRLPPLPALRGVGGACGFFLGGAGLGAAPV